VKASQEGTFSFMSSGISRRTDGHRSFPPCEFANRSRPARYQVVGASAGAGERLEQDRHSRVGPLRPELFTEFPIRAPSCQVHPRLGIGSCREKPFGLYGSAEIVKWRITEIPDQHYTSMRFRDWFAPVTVIALEA
jgi:hypothetical protein